MDEQTTCNIKFLSDTLDITPARISQLESDGIVKKAGRNEYYLSESVRNYLKFVKNRFGTSDDVSIGDYNSERTRLTKIKADLAELEKEQVSSKLIPSADVEQAWAVMVTNAKTRLLSIPVKIASALFAAQNNMNAIREIVEIQIIEALQELSNVQVRTVNPVRISDNSDDIDGGDKTIQSSAETDRKPMGRSKQKAIS